MQHQIYDALGLMITVSAQDYVESVTQDAFFPSKAGQNQQTVINTAPKQGKETPCPNQCRGGCDKSNMTSPYLNRPRRELKDALQERGLDDAWLNARQKPAAFLSVVPTLATVPARRTQRGLSTAAVVVGIAFLLGMMALGTTSLFDRTPTEVASEPEIESLMDIAPAAGPATTDAAPEPQSAVVLPAMFGKLPDSGMLDPSPK